MKYLSLIDIRGGKRAVGWQMLADLPNLQTLNLYLATLDFTGIQSLQIFQLKKLEITCHLIYPRLIKININDISKHFPLLESLVLRSIDARDESYEDGIFKSFENLRILELEDVFLPEHFPNGRFPQLEELYISRNVSHFSLTMIRPSIRKISIANVELSKLFIFASESNLYFPLLEELFLAVDITELMVRILKEIFPMLKTLKTIETSKSFLNYQ